MGTAGGRTYRCILERKRLVYIGEKTCQELFHLPEDYAYNAANRMAESHVTEIRGGSRQTPKDTVYSYDSFGRRILEADILNRWVRHTEYRGLSMDVWKNAAVHGIKEPRNSRGIDSTGMVFKNLNDFLPAFADFSRASPYDFTHVALTLPLTAGGEVLGLLQTEHSGIGFNPFVNASHTDAERHYFGKDHLGSVRAVTNQWGSPLYMFDYDVFGTPLQDRPERFRHGFTGKEYDSWTGLYNYGFRDYSAMFGRFTSVDPIQDGHNWYACAVSDPVSWLDPWGLECPDQESGEDAKRNEKSKKTTKRLVKSSGKNVFDSYLLQMMEDEYSEEEMFRATMDYAEQKFSEDMIVVQDYISITMEKTLSVANDAIIMGEEFMSDYGEVIAVVCYASGNIGLGMIIDGVSLACDISLTANKFMNHEITREEALVDFAKTAVVTATGNMVGKNFERAAERVLLDEKTTKIVSGILSDFVAQGTSAFDYIQNH